MRKAFFGPTILAIAALATSSLLAQTGTTQSGTASAAAGQAAVDTYNNRHANVPPADIMRWLTHRTVPVTPPEASAAHVGGNVVVSVEIDKDGKVINVQAVSGPEILRQAAIDCAKQWTFHPYVIDGNPVFVDTTLTISFISL